MLLLALQLRLLFQLCHPPFTSLLASALLLVLLLARFHLHLQLFDLAGLGLAALLQLLEALLRLSELAFHSLVLL